MLLKQTIHPSIFYRSSDGDWSTLENNKNFVDYLVTIIGFTRSANTQSNAVMEEINNALDLIEKEITE